LNTKPHSEYSVPEFCQRLNNRYNAQLKTVYVQHFNFQLMHTKLKT